MDPIFKVFYKIRIYSERKALNTTKVVYTLEKILNEAKKDFEIDAFSQIKKHWQFKTAIEEKLKKVADFVHAR